MGRELGFVLGGHTWVTYSTMAIVRSPWCTWVEEVGDAASLIFFVGAFVALAFGFGAGGLSSWLLVSLLCLRSAWWLLGGTK